MIKNLIVACTLLITCIFYECYTLPTPEAKPDPSPWGHYHHGFGGFGPHFGGFGGYGRFGGYGHFGGYGRHYGGFYPGPVIPFGYHRPRFIGGGGIIIAGGGIGFGK